MHTIPHVTCSKVLDTVRLSGLTYSLTETPYSAYLSIRKKFTKGFSPTTSSSTVSLSSSSTSDSAGTNKFSSDTQASETDAANQLIVKEAELSKLKKTYEKLVIESKNELSMLTSSVNKLTQELATEIDDHAESEQAVRKLEEKHETIKMELNKKAQENKALKDHISSCEAEVSYYQKHSQNIKDSLVETEIKLAEAHNAEAGILKSKVHELEGTVTGKNRIISLLKDQSVISEKENSNLKSKLSELQSSLNYQSNPTQKSPIIFPTLASTLSNLVELNSLRTKTSLKPCNPTPASPSHKLNFSDTHTSQSDISTLTLNDQKALAKTDTDDSDTSHDTLYDQIVSGDFLATEELSNEIDETNKDTDINDNIAPNPGRNMLLKFLQVAETSNPNSSYSNQSSPSLMRITDPANFCNKCHTKPEYDDIVMDLPPPIYELNFIHDCPSPWLHYGYCTACLEVAWLESSKRGHGNAITEHITQCPGLLDHCSPSDHEIYTQMCTDMENEFRTNSHQ